MAHNDDAVHRLDTLRRTVDCLKVVVIGIVTYAVVAALLMHKTNRIPLGDALKNVE